MATAWRNLMKILGLGKDKDEKKKNAPLRVHPYDEVDDEQLQQNRRQAARIHPYDEVSDAVLEENRSQRDAQRHDYDEVAVQPSGRGPAIQGGKPSATSGTTPELNYVEVEVTAGQKRTPPSQPTIYSDIRPSAS